MPRGRPTGLVDLVFVVVVLSMPRRGMDLTALHDGISAWSAPRPLVYTCRLKV